MKRKRLIICMALAVAAVGNARAAGDLDWIPLAGTDRVPSAVLSATAGAAAVDTRPGPFAWSSGLSDVYTYSWGLLLLLR